jgi:hypothetical protein
VTIRTLIIALVALLLVLIIGNALVVRELAPRLAGSKGAGISSRDAKPMTEWIARGSGRERPIATTSDRNSAAVRAPFRRPVSPMGRLAPLAASDDTRLALIRGSNR